MHIREGLVYDDVLLVPAYSDLKSRSEVDLSVELPKGFKINHPIIPANMKTVTGIEMAETIFNTRGLSILHRFMPFEEQLDIVKTLKSKEEKDSLSYIGLSVGVKPEDYEYVDKFVDAGVKVLCIDVAHGDSKMCEDMCQYISKRYPQILLIAGNVATESGAVRLWHAGADLVKVNVGSGSLCTTRIETGNGVPSITCLMEIYAAAQIRKRQYPKKFYGIIADGGINSAGNCVKALCFADLIMIGNLFAGTDECPGKVFIKNGKSYKSYVGSSTHKLNHIEGVKASVPYKGPVKNILEKLFEGIRSGCSYQGVRNLLDLKNNPQFIRITNAGLKESHPHDVLLEQDYNEV